MINHRYGDQTPKFELQEEKVDITAFRQKDPLEKTPLSKVKIFLEGGAFW